MSGWQPPSGTWAQRFGQYRRELGAAQKPGDGVPAYMRWVNRSGARAVAAAAAAWGWTPNFVSLVSVCLSAAGMALLVALPPAWWTGIPVGVLLAAGFLFDSADGQVSRVTHASSKTRPRSWRISWRLTPLKTRGAPLARSWPPTTSTRVKPILSPRGAAPSRASSAR